MSWQDDFDRKFGDLGTFNEDDIDKIESLIIKHLDIKDFIQNTVIPEAKDEDRERIIEIIKQ